MDPSKVTVLYIAGYSRSGSTLLLRLLSQMHGFLAVGELWDIWDRSFSQNQLCGCGQPFRTCAYWNQVVEEAFGGFQHIDAGALQALRASVQSNRHIPLLTMPFLRTPGYRERLAEYVGSLDGLYRGISRVSGAQVIVDSSKVPTYAFVLKEAPGIDLRIVHLVRDSRATAYSWQRKKLRPEIHWKTAYMDRYSPMRAALEWNIMNALVHLLDRPGTQYTRVLYEDLVADPCGSLERIVSELKLGNLEQGLFDSQQAVRFGVDHTVSGNPNRFQQGPVVVKPDREWMNKLSGFDRKVVTGLTWPLLTRYGYLTRKSDEGPANIAVAPEKANGAGPAKRRVLLVTPRYLPHVGGTEIHTYELGRRLVSSGYDVTVLTTDLTGRLPESVRMAGIDIRRVRAWPRNSDYYFAPGIVSFIKQGKWDLIHCQGYHTFVSPLVMLAARRANIPYVVTFHSGGHSSRLRNFLRPIQREFLRPLLARARGLVAVSRWEADYFRKHLRLPDDLFHVIPNGSYLYKNRKITPISEKGSLILSIGRLEQYKGHHRVIEAMPLLLKKDPKIRLRIVGSGPFEEKLWQAARDHGVIDHVEIRAVQGTDREGMAEVMMGASLVILLSSYESQGISVMEAISLGRPVLVADATALHELAASGLARATPLGSNAEEIAGAIFDQLRQPLIPDTRDLPTWEACAEKVLALYRQITPDGAACAS